MGSQAWLKKHPEIAPKVVMMINRDGSPMALTGVRVPETWYQDMQAIAAPLAHAFPKWPFTVEKTLPRAHATSPGGTDSSSFEMLAVPTLSFATQTDYVYSYAWHTTNDLYSELVPYTEQQQESAVVHAVMAYGVANLDKPLTREGVYLADGMYAAITVGSAEAPRQLMFSLDFVNAPIQTANFIRIAEGKPAAGGAGRGGGGGGGRGGGPGGPGGRGGAPAAPPIGSIADVKGGLDQRARRVRHSEVGGDSEAPDDEERGGQARRRRHPRRVGSEPVLHHAPEERGPRQEVHGARQGGRRARRVAGHQEGRPGPEHPDHTGRPACA